MFLLVGEQTKTTRRVVRGRQVLNALGHVLTSGVYVTDVVTWRTLANVEPRGNNLAEFTNRWYRVLAAIRVRLDQYSLVEVMTKKLPKFSVLAKDMEYVDALPVNLEDQSCQWLMVRIQKHIAKHKEIELQRELENGKG